MTLKNTISTAIVMSAFVVALAGCQKEAGPAEKAGQQIEKAGDNI
jgi:hypothetical protein